MTGQLDRVSDSNVCGPLSLRTFLFLPFESFPAPADPTQSLLIYTAEPGSPTQDALRLLASWAATGDTLLLPLSCRDAGHGAPSPKAE